MQEIEKDKKLDLSMVFTRLGDHHQSTAEVHYVAEKDIFLVTLSNSSEVLVAEVKGDEFRKQAYQSEKVLENLYGE